MQADGSKDSAVFLLGALADEIADRLASRLAPQLVELVEAGGFGAQQRSRSRRRDTSEKES